MNNLFRCSLLRCLICKISMSIVDNISNGYVSSDAASVVVVVFSSR